MSDRIVLPNTRVH